MSTYRRFWDDKPVEAVSYFRDDFFRYNTADWTLTTVEAGAGSATEAIGDGPNGLLVITNDAADNDYDAFQSKEIARFIAGKKLSFAARFKVSDVVESDLMIGLHITDTDPINSAPSDGVYFRKDDGDALLDCVVAKNSTASTLVGVAGTPTALVNDTFVTVEFYYDGTDEVQFYVNNVRVGSLPITNLPDDEDLAVSFAIQNGAAAAKVLTMDFVEVRQER